MRIELATSWSTPYRCAITHVHTDVNNLPRVVVRSRALAEEDRTRDLVVVSPKPALPLRYS